MPYICVYHNLPGAVTAPMRARLVSPPDAIKPCLTSMVVGHILSMPLAAGTIQ